MLHSMARATTQILEAKLLQSVNNKQETITRQTYDYCADDVAQNFMFIFGNAPGKSVLAETQMVYELVQTLAQRFDVETLTIQIPQAFNYFKGQDA